MTTDEKIIAAAGEPVAWVIDGTEYNASGERTILREIDYYNEIVDLLPVDTKLYTADAILSAAKPLRERIAELEAEVRQLRATPPEQRQDLHCVVSDISSECRELRQQNAELTKQLEEIKNAS